MAMGTAGAADRRLGDRTRGSEAVRGAVAGALEGEPVRLGRALLLAAGLVVAATVPLQRPHLRGWLVLLAVSAAMTAVLLVSLLLPWARLPRGASLLFPVSVGVALGALGAGAGLGAPYTGLLVLCFAYTGLTQRPPTNLRLVPAAAAAYVTAQAAWSRWSVELSIRLLIAIAVWVVLSQLLAALTARQHALAHRLLAAAHTDALTGLPNRRDLQDRLDTTDATDAMAASATIVMIDLDHFKQLNDTLGHSVGDRVLAEFGLLLRASLRSGDYAARYGGEEFVLLLPDTSNAQARVVLARLRQHWDLLQPAVTFSAGFTSLNWHAHSSAALHAADQALYAAKAAGRNCDREASGTPPSTASQDANAAAAGSRIVTGEG